MVTVEVCRRVAQEVEVGVGHAHPNHAPHPLPELCDDLQQFQLREAEIGHRAEVGPQQRLVLGVGEGMVYREVSEIEIDVAHRRVLPVDYPQQGTVVYPVWPPEVVMT